MDDAEHYYDTDILPDSGEVIYLTPEEFDRFEEMCNTKHPIPKKLREAADRLDRYGYTINSGDENNAN